MAITYICYEALCTASPIYDLKKTINLKDNKQNLFKLFF